MHKALEPAALLHHRSCKFHAEIYFVLGSQHEKAKNVFALYVKYNFTEDIFLSGKLLPIALLLDLTSFHVPRKENTLASMD